MTIGVPGNVPYVITVGAMSDDCNPGDAADDFLTSFSAAGPTLEGFVKPELVAPGGHMLGLMPSSHQIALRASRVPAPAPATSRCRAPRRRRRWSAASSP